jgi:2-oxoglutarate dehydrogenase E2 component (dihydrolipoamide succinyltransferase)
VNIKNQHAQEFLEREGGKLSYMPFFIKTVAGALKEFPAVNASISGTDIIYKKDVNIGVAVALDWGLIVPVVKNADEKSFLGSPKCFSLARARQKRLAPEDPGGIQSRIRRIRKFWERHHQPAASGHSLSAPSRPSYQRRDCHPFHTYLT